jgi:hypothetical protein
MKRQVKIVLRIILFFTILFGFGIEDPPKHNISNISEMLSEKLGDSGILISEIDSIDEDQLSQSFAIKISAESRYLIPIIRVSGIVNIFSISIWQPPKYSV